MTAIAEPSITVSRWLTCPECGVESYRQRTFTGPSRNEHARAWSPDPRCSRHIKAVAR